MENRALLRAHVVYHSSIGTKVNEIAATGQEERRGLVWVMGKGNSGWGFELIRTRRRVVQSIVIVPVRPEATPKV